MIRRRATVVVALLLAACTSSPASPPAPMATAPSVIMAPSVDAAPAPASGAPTIAETLRDGAWTDAVRAAIGDLPVAVAVGTGGEIVLVEGPADDRALASGQKVLTSMTALAAFGPRHRFPTVAAAGEPRDGGTLAGDLWLVGSGDPDGGQERVDALAAQLAGRGIRRIEGGVVGDIDAFTHEWWAPGWLPGISRRYVRPATALAWEGNVGHDPELTATAALTAALEARGIAVGRPPSVGAAPDGLTELAAARSAPLADLLARQNHDSWNFAAEMLAKALGAHATGGRGRTADGAAAIAAWARTMGVDVTARDGSGLSHQDRASVRDLVTLLLLSRREPWADAFVSSLPRGGEGTLEGRLTDVEVRAKTGTLIVEVVSTLAGFVQTRAGPAAFAIVSNGVPITTAKAIEDRIVRILARARLG